MVPMLAFVHAFSSMVKFMRLGEVHDGWWI